MAEQQPKQFLSRRGALKIIAGSAGASISLPILRSSPLEIATHVHTLRPVVKPPQHVPKFFDSQQMQNLDALCETILPADEHSPGARAARVNEYIDEIISGSDETVKALWRDGLAAMRQMAELGYGRNFAECTAEQQQALVERISLHEEHPTTLEERFFVAIKNATAEGYYTSEVGIHQDLEYQGNSALLEFEGCTHPEHKS